jgi:hypothetical protein
VTLLLVRGIFKSPGLFARPTFLKKTEARDGGTDVAWGARRRKARSASLTLSVGRSNPSL